MEPVYYVSAEPGTDGEHEVHMDACYLLPKESRFLGKHPSCGAALAQASKIYPKVVGCRVCTFNSPSP